MCEECAQLRERVSTLEERVAELEGGGETTTSEGFGDHRDQAVLDVLEPGSRVALSDIRSLYRQHTDVTNARTVKRRTKALLKDGPIDQHGQVWIYRGGRDE